MLLIERALKCVVFIGAVSDPDGPSPVFVPYGTGFLFSVFHEEIRFDYIVTCHHIIELFKGDTVWIRLNLKEGGSKPIPVFKDSWISDPKQDISVLSQPIGGLFFDVTRIVEKDVVSKEILKDDRLNILPGELTFLIGLFTIHHGYDQNVPIVRLGNIAAIPKEKIWTETGYIKAYLVETRSIGGLSGSPVFLNIISWRTNWNLPRDDDQIDTFFLGMMRGRFITQDKNDVVRSEIRDDKEAKEIIDKLPPELKKAFLALMEKQILLDDVNTGIGIVIPAEVIFDFINQPAFVTQREETVKELKKKTHYRNSAATPKSDNPRHKEDFNSLLTAAVKKKPPTDET